jgi:predicted ATPase
VLARATNDLAESAPLLAALLLLPTGERYPPLGLTPQKQKERTLQALVAQVEALAARQPVLMLLEDAHWSDPTSLELLDLIIDRVLALPVLLIISFRPEFTGPWTGRPNVSLLALSRLAARQRAEMIAGVTGGKALPKEIAEQIIDRTDGVPLFVEELTKAVVESGMLTDWGDHYTAMGPIAPLAIPASLQASLLARLDRLAPVREMAQLGAALGRQFSHELIAAVAPMPAAQLDAALEQLVGAELLYRRGIPPDAEYTFKHALVQDAAYGTLLRSRRQQLHARIAATLEVRFSEIVTAQPALLAYHCTEAGLTVKALDYWLAAGRQAWARSAVAEAVALLRRGLGLVPALPDGEERQERELELEIALGQALLASRGWGAAEAGEAYTRARELALRLNRPRTLIFALWGLFANLVCRAEHERGRLLAAEMRELGETSGDIPTRVMACSACAFNYFCLGEFAAARACVEEALALYDPAHRQLYAELLPKDMLVTLLHFSTIPLASLGYLDQARSRAETALIEARRLTHAHTLIDTVAYAWFTGWSMGFEPASLLQWADEVMLAADHELAVYRAFGTLTRGWGLAAMGRWGEGVPLLTAGLAHLYDTGFTAHTTAFLTLLADGCRMAGQLQAALAHLAEARRFAEQTGDRWALAEALRLRGDVLLAIDDRSGAEAGYREAIGVAQQQSAKLWELRAATSLARLCRDQGRRAEARNLLAPVYGWFTEGFTTPILLEAKALVEGLAA